MARPVAYLRVSTLEQDLEKNKADSLLLAHKHNLGRVGKSKLDGYRPEMMDLLANGSTQQFIARRHPVTGTTLSHWLKKHHLEKGAFSL